MKYLLTLALITFISLTAFTQSLSWQKASPDYTINAKPGKGYMIMTNARSASMTLPQNPSDGDAIGFMDVAGTFSNNSLTVNPGNIPIDGNRGVKVYSTPNSTTTLVYSSSPYGWKTVSSGASSGGGNPVLDDVSVSDTSRWGLLNIVPVTLYGALGDGTTDNTVAFNDAVTTSNEIFIPEGNFLLAGTVSIPPGKRLVFANGALLNVTGNLVGNSSEINAPLSQVFSLSSNLTGTWKGYAFPEWFGAKVDNATPSGAAINKTRAVFHNVEFASGTYIIEESVKMYAYDNFKGNNTVFQTGAYLDEPVLLIRSKPVFVDDIDLYAPHYAYMNDSTGNDVTNNYNHWLCEAKIERSWHTDSLDDFRYPSRFTNMKVFPSSFGERYPTARLYKPNGIKLGLDTTRISSGTVKVNRHYMIVDYQPGDDFSNIADDVAGTVNTTGYRFNATGTTPETWSNGSIVRQVDNASYDDVFDNVYISDCDSSMFIYGDEYSGMYNTVHFANGAFDNNYQGVFSTNRAAGHIFSNNFYQPKNSAFDGTTFGATNADREITLTTNDWSTNYLQFKDGQFVRLYYSGGSMFARLESDAVWDGSNTVFMVESDRLETYDSTKTVTSCVALLGAFPMFKLDGQYNVVDGMIWDLWYENTIIIPSSAANNEFGSLGQEDLARNHTLNNSKATSKVGSYPMWEQLYTGGNYQNYLFNGNRMVIVDNLNSTDPHAGWNKDWYYDGGHLNDEKGVLQIYNDPTYHKPMLYTHVSNGSSNLRRTYANHHFRHTSSNVSPREGFGFEEEWTFESGHGESGTMGEFLLRQADGYIQSIGINTEMIWRIDSLGEGLRNKMTLGPDGLNVRGTFSSANINDDGTGVTIDDILLIKPRSSAPSSPAEGTIYVNSSDNHIYIYLSSSWHQIDNL